MENTGTKVCPFCAETIKSAAKICPYCQWQQGRGGRIVSWVVCCTIILLIVGTGWWLFRLFAPKRSFSEYRDQIVAFSPNTFGWKWRVS